MRGSQDNHLLGLLQRNEVLKAKGYSLNSTPPDSIVIDRFGHVHGIWTYDGRQYAWLSPNNTKPNNHTNNPNTTNNKTHNTQAQP